MMSWVADMICDRCTRTRAPCYVGMIDGQIQVMPPASWVPQASGKIYCPKCKDAGDLVKLASSLAEKDS
jgi:hypothetical protein